MKLHPIECAMILTLVAALVMLSVCYNNNHPASIDQIITTADNLDNLKADCYTQGFVDGRASRLEEESLTGHKFDRLGVPEGYNSTRTKEWREYADYIAGYTMVAP